MNVDALDDIGMKACFPNFANRLHDPFLRPFFSCGHVMKRPYESFDARNLPDLPGGHGVVALAVPAEGHSHAVISPYDLK